ncbi:hypothetical protein [Roseivirga echinicomitans]|uniref:hypothetical protein n=1 Tax=Roseivirga echinicomitans TaxID=296218 RepID=UPI000A694040|nr:hypothetical protein [Roseivirga echinicomitans]
MKHGRLLFLLVLLSSLASAEVNAQFWKKKNKSDVQAFTPGEAKEKEEVKMVSPMREMLNKFNLQLEKGSGFFLYENELTDVSVVRNPRGDQLYIVPIGQESTSGPYHAYSNWFNDLTPTSIYRIDDDSQIVRTDTSSVIYKNSGTVNPFTLRLSFSLNKVDKLRLKTTGERVMSDKEFLRVGVGISSGTLKFTNMVNYQEVDDRLGYFNVPQTKISTTKLFASLTYNAYTFMDFSFMIDAGGGFWKTKASDLNQDLVTYDPFFNVGVIMEKQVSKYFKLYLRPSFEMRKYSLSDEFITTAHSLSLFTIDIGALIKYPTYPRNRHGANRVQMEHVFNGRIYRGRSIFQPQNPRAGQFGQNKKKKVKYGGRND